MIRQLSDYLGGDHAVSRSASWNSIYGRSILNAALISALIWIAYAVARSISSHNLIFRVGVPLTVACFPQDVFFVINNDTLRPFAAG